MSGEGSTPGGARASISRVGEACRIQIGRNDVFLECFHERKGSITTLREILRFIRCPEKAPLLVVPLIPYRE